MLLKLHRKEAIKRPKAKLYPNLVKKSSLKADDDSFTAPATIQCSLAELGRIKLIRIKPRDRAQSRRWNAMMQKNHYLGSGPLCGTQIRHFIQSEQF